MAQGHEFRRGALGGSRELAFSAWLRHGFGVRLCCFQVPHRYSNSCAGEKKSSSLIARREGAFMNLTTLSTLAMMVSPTSVRVGAGILCAVFIVIIIARRKKMASKRRPIP